MIYNTLKFENTKQLNSFINIFDLYEIILDSERLTITTYDEDTFDTMLRYIASNNYKIDLLKIEKE
jgi:hypothetical protein